MLFRNTSSPNNPFASETSLLTSVYQSSRNRGHNPSSIEYSSKPSATRLRIYDKTFFEPRETNITSINDIKHENPFDRCTNLQDLVREGLQQKHDYQRSRKHSQSPLRSNFVSGYNRQQPSKYHDSYGTTPTYGVTDYRGITSSSYVPGGYGSADYGGSYPGPSSYVPSADYVPTYAPVKTEEQHGVQTDSFSKASKFKPVPSYQQSNHYSFDQQKRTQNGGSISEYFPNPPKYPPLQKKDSVMSTNSNQPNSMKNSLNKKQSVRSNNIGFSSGDQRETFGVSSRMQNRVEHDDPFDDLKPHMSNEYQSFVDEKSSWPEFIELGNQKLYFRPLKPKPKMKSA